jgi:hypothetical protein
VEKHKTLLREKKILISPFKLAPVLPFIAAFFVSVNCTLPSAVLALEADWAVDSSGLGFLMVGVS